MKFTIDIDYNEILRLARQLPHKYKEKLRQEMRKDLDAEIKGKPVDRDIEDSECLSHLQHFLSNDSSITCEHFERCREMKNEADGLTEE